MRRHPGGFSSGGESGGGAARRVGGASGHGRLNLLLTNAGWEPDPWVDRLPKMLEPMGVRSIHARSGVEAGQVIEEHEVHIAVVDLGLPLDAEKPSPSAGPKLLEVLRRLEQPPPTVVIRNDPTARQLQREMAAALRMGAFAVVDRPRAQRDLELLLEVLRRCLTRHYGGRWPGLT
ncbi:MAG: response regulator [Planctomycetota bacterium]